MTSKTEDNESVTETDGAVVSTATTKAEDAQDVAVDTETSQKTGDKETLDLPLGGKSLPGDSDSVTQQPDWTVKRLEESWRKFNIDLTPKVC